MQLQKAEAAVQQQKAQAAEVARRHHAELADSHAEQKRLRSRAEESSKVGTLDLFLLSPHGCCSGLAWQKAIPSAEIRSFIGSGLGLEVVSTPLSWYTSATPQTMKRVKPFKMHISRQVMLRDGA